MRASLLRVLQPVVFVLLISGSGVGLPADTPLPLPAFPSARGFGSDTPGGRGGVTVEVTSLADSGPGSLREALSREQPRTVVFRVGGTIELARPLTVTAPFLTLAGQTAPGDGVCLKGAGLEIATHDVIIRHLRVRPGAPAAAGLPGEAIRIRGGRRVVLDHLSAFLGEGEHGAHRLRSGRSRP